MTDICGLCATSEYTYLYGQQLLHEIATQLRARREGSAAGGVGSKRKHESEGEDMQLLWAQERQILWIAQALESSTVWHTDPGTGTTDAPHESTVLKGRELFSLQLNSRILQRSVSSLEDIVKSNVVNVLMKGHVDSFPVRTIVSALFGWVYVYHTVYTERSLTAVIVYTFRVVSPLMDFTNSVQDFLNVERLSSFAPGNMLTLIQHREVKNCLMDE